MGGYMCWWLTFLINFMTHLIGPSLVLQLVPGACDLALEDPTGKHQLSARANGQ